MNIRKVSFGLVASAMLSGTLSGCSESKYADRAKAQAVKYLNGNDSITAEFYARQQKNSDDYSGDAIVYWDSLLAEAKTKEAYFKGYQLVKDSLNGKHYRKEKFKPLLSTICNEYCIDDVRMEYAKYTSTTEFLKARGNAPKDAGAGFANQLVSTTHYWNLITISGKQNEAYQKGMADARKELNK